MRTAKTSFFLLLILWATAGCQATDVPPTVPATFQLSLKDQVTDLNKVSKIVLQVSGDGFTPIVVNRTPPFEDIVNIDVNVPAGTAREFKVTAVVDSALFFGHPERFGYVGRVVADVATDEVNIIPIFLKFINFAEDPVNDEVDVGDPDLDFVAVDNNDQGTSDFADDQVTMRFHFSSPINTKDLILILEFDIDNNRLTGKTTTVIADLLDVTASPLITLFETGSEFYWVIQGNPSKGPAGTPPYSLELHNFQDNLVTIPAALIPDIKSNLPNPSELEFRLPRRVFNELMGDPDHGGDMSVLAGINTLTSISSYIHITPAQFPQFFHPADVILEIESFGSIRYDLGFKTTGL